MMARRAVVRWELRAAVRSRWLVASALAFGGAAVSIVVVGLRGARDLGLAGAGPAAAGLVGLSLLLPSLIGILLGSGALAGARERGDLAMMLAQPIPRGAFIAASFAGLVSAVWLVAALGFAAAIVVVSSSLRPEDVILILTTAGSTFALAAAGVSIGMFVSALARSRAQATASGVAIWFVFGAGVDLVLATLVPALGIGAAGLLAATLLNPFEAARVLALLGAGSDGAAFGPFGSYLLSSFGAAGSASLLVAALVAWIVVPLIAATAVVTRRDV